MKRFRLFLTLVMLFCLTGVWADDTGLKLHFNFDGGSVKEAVSNGSIVGTLKNSAKVVKFGKYYALDLGSSNGYFDMGADAGKALAACDDYSVSMYYYINSSQTITDAGNFLFAFSTSNACSATAGVYSAYRVNVQRFATSTGGSGSEKGIQAGTASDKGCWVSVIFVQNGTTGTLYINGRKIGTESTTPASTLFAAKAPSCMWIGRSPFSNDVYLKNTKVADIRVYGKALTKAEVTRLAVAVDDIDNDYRHGTQGDLTSLNTLLAEAENLLKGNVSAYPAAAVSLLKDTYDMIKAKENETLSQYAIDDYKTTLQEAINSFKATSGFAFADTEEMPSYNTNRGFKHPGGLHTQADFDRVRAQIAAGTNEKVLKAYNILKNAEYAQSTAATYPVQTIIRGGGSGENYINAARGATIAYQNALRWKLEDNKACANHAVEVLNAWARTCKGVGGDSNYALGAGLYGYEFAQAAELMRDYEGWKAEDFKAFQQWMLDVWYSSSIGFLRGRNGTWENSSYKPGVGWGTDGDRPGHYWSNWGLCNALCLVSIGVLCDDVFIYNQGLSFVKYDLADLAGSCPNRKRTETDIWNNGLAEYIDNLIPNVAEYAGETGAYGKVGQMQESGRDQGHATMALGLAVDICQVAWNQGDDLYSYHDNRMAAGIEFTAAYNNAGKDDLPWVTYHYADCRTAWHNAWNQTVPNGGSRGQVRPYWARIIGHYEGVKGVKMPFAEMALEAMGIDGGPSGGSSGAYDHMGYTTLMCTYDKMAAENERPTLLTPKMIYKGETLEHNELGGISSTYKVDTNMGVPVGETVKLCPQLPEGATNTGKWQWNTGETTQDITVTTDKSYLYRVTYINENGVKSEQVFAIVSQGDASPYTMTCTIKSNGVQVGTNEATVYYGSSVDLTVGTRSGWGEGAWNTGVTGTTLHIPSVTSDCVIKGQYVSQNGLPQTMTFRIHTKSLQPQALVNNELVEDSVSFLGAKDDNYAFYAYVPSSLSNVKYEWNDGSTGKYMVIDALDACKDYTVHVTADGGLEETIKFSVLLPEESFGTVEDGKYAIYDSEHDVYLTNDVENGKPIFTACKAEAGKYDESQVWTVAGKVSSGVTKYTFTSLVGDLKCLDAANVMKARSFSAYYLKKLVGSDKLAISTAKTNYWTVDDELNFEPKGAAEAKKFPFVLVPITDDMISTGVSIVDSDNGDEVVKTEYYTISGAKTNGKTTGVNLVKYTLRSGKTVTKKVVVK